eukprot:COSAG04_NODE_3028_length_3257_cov_2.112413_4_plen_297_part_00
MGNGCVRYLELGGLRGEVHSRRRRPLHARAPLVRPTFQILYHGFTTGLGALPSSDPLSKSFTTRVWVGAGVGVGVGSHLDACAAAAGRPLRLTRLLSLRNTHGQKGNEADNLLTTTRQEAHDDRCGQKAKRSNADLTTIRRAQTNTHGSGQKGNNAEGLTTARQNETTKRQRQMQTNHEQRRRKRTTIDQNRGVLAAHESQPLQLLPPPRPRPSPSADAVAGGLLGGGLSLRLPPLLQACAAQRGRSGGSPTTRNVGKYSHIIRIRIGQASLGRMFTTAGSNASIHKRTGAKARTF